MINNRGILSTSNLLSKTGGPYTQRAPQQNLPNNDGITRAADTQNKQQDSNITQNNQKGQEQNQKLNNSEKNPSGRANNLASQAPDKASQMSKSSDPRYSQDTAPPEFQEPKTDGVSGDTTPQLKSQPPVPNEDKSSAMRYLEKKATEKTGEMTAGEGTGDQQSENRGAPKPHSTPIDRADTPHDPRKNPKSPNPNQPSIQTPTPKSPAVKMPNFSGAGKMRMPQLRIPKMR